MESGAPTRIRLKSTEKENMHLDPPTHAPSWKSIPIQDRAANRPTPPKVPHKPAKLSCKPAINIAPISPNGSEDEDTSSEPQSLPVATNYNRMANSNSAPGPENNLPLAILGLSSSFNTRVPTNDIEDEDISDDEDDKGEDGEDDVDRELEQKLVLPEFPDPPYFTGVYEDDADFTLFCESLCAKIDFQKALFDRSPKFKIIYAMRFLGPTLRKLIVDKWNKDRREFDGIEDHKGVIRVIEEHLEQPEETYRFLLQSKADLEERIRALKRKMSKESVAPGLAFHNWNQFKECFETQPVSAIEILIGKPKFYWQQSRDEDSSPLITESPIVPSDEELKSWFDEWKEGRDIPERIRINSFQLIQVLRKIHSGERSVNDDKTPMGNRFSVVFLRPYKFFYHYHAEISAREKDLKERISSSTKPLAQRDQNEDAANDPVSDDVKDGESQEELLQHLQHLIKFIHSAVLPIGNRLRMKVDDYNAPTRVCFQDLWYLFQPGDYVSIAEDLPEQKDNKKAVMSGALCKSSAWRVFNVAGGRPLLCPPTGDERTAPNDPWEPLRLVLYKIDYSGTTSSFGPTPRNVTIPFFEGEKDITSLKAVPLRFNRDHVQKDAFYQLGRKFIQLTKERYVHQQYTGPTLTISPTGMDYRGAENAMLDGERVMVDFQDSAIEKTGWVPYLLMPEEESVEELCFREAWPLKIWRKKDENREKEEIKWNGKGDRTWESKYRPENIYNDTHVDGSLTQKHQNESKLLTQFVKWVEGPTTEIKNVTHEYISEDDMVLLPNRVCAFRLTRREYINITVEDLVSLPGSSGGWDEVVFHNPSHRKILEALVKTHRAKRDNAYGSRAMTRPQPGQDLVVGKGEGLIILLHGKPGVGKTSTVECLSENLKIPLLPLSCGALGSRPTEIESHLRWLFRKAERWNCIILFDEADVVLVERDRNQMAQNEVCSIFLRELEYCQGVVFLTSNRAGHIDEAVKSRVHVAIYYPPLSDASLETIWGNNLQRLKKMSNAKRKIKFQKGKHDIKQKSLEFIKDHNLMEVCNGRTIRNVCHVALSLAEDASSSEHGTINLDWDPYFRDALETWRAFEEYMVDTRGGISDSRRAMESGIRADHSAVLSQPGSTQIKRED